VARAVVSVLSAPPGYAAYNIAAPQSVSLNEVLRTLVEIDGFVDAEIIHRLDRSGGASAVQVTATTFGARFGWEPALPLRQGLAETVQWYRRASPSAR
jgi:nucleoside-diphosphate-sugar epimerase